MTEPTVAIRAAGGIVLRGERETAQVLLVHRPRYDDWSLPKGKLTGAESQEQAALREVEEETGLRCRLGELVGDVSYTDRSGRPKVVRYWVMRPEGGSFSPTEEVDAVRWVPVSSASEQLTYAHDRDLLARLAARTPTGPLYVVRHAKAGDRTRWRRPDPERPLTPRGRRQAERLVGRFDGVPIARIVSSPFVRCLETVEPLARARGLGVERAPELAEGAGVDAVVGFVGALDRRPTVLCGHGSEIEALIASLRAQGAALGPSGRLAKGSVWVLERRDGSVVGGRYESPPSR